MPAQLQMCNLVLEHKFNHSHTYSPHHHVRSHQEAKYAKNGKNADIRGTKLSAKAVRDRAINALYAFLSRATGGKTLGGTTRCIFQWKAACQREIL